MNYINKIFSAISALALILLMSACEDKYRATGNHGAMIDSTATVEPIDASAVGTERNSGSGILGTGTSARDPQKRNTYYHSEDSIKADSSPQIIKKPTP